MDYSSPADSLEQAHDKVCDVIKGNSTSDVKSMYETWADTYNQAWLSIFYS